ncbi:MAG: signal recognition particle protein [Magnetococcales bacterium]|nr:signal recognition particle protein [Magnetococcales bacterium]
MFDSLSGRLDTVFKKLRGRGSLNEKNIQDSLREVRRALLEADVSLSVVKSFIDSVQEKAVGREVLGSLTPGQQVIKVVHEELIHLMGDVNSELNLAAQPPVVVMMVGLQGSGKTTSTGKLAKRLLEKNHKRSLLVSLDVYRPAAMDQLVTVGGSAGVDVMPTKPTENPRDIAKRALDAARNGNYDILFFDTAGRLHIDDELMDELADIRDIVNPTESLLVADSMTGQDAITVAQSFDEKLGLTGVILTKTDGDARGGAALSIRHVTGKPIKFIGTSEALTGLEPFHPERIASRILGMGDVLTLVETAMEKVDFEEAAKLQKKLEKSSFNLEDFLSQMQQVQKMGSMKDLVGMIPGMKNAIKGREDQLDDSKLKRIEAIILSMTIAERKKHQLLNASRKRRIAAGSGTSVQEVNRMLKQFVQTQKMMKKMGKLGPKGMFGGGMPGIPGMGGGGGMGGLGGMMPQGFPGFKRK